MFKPKRPRLTAAAVALALAVYVEPSIAKAETAYRFQPIGLPRSDVSINSLDGLNDAGQILATVSSADAFGGTVVRIDSDGSAHALGPRLSIGAFLLEDGRAVMESFLPDGWHGITVGDDSGWQKLPLPTGFSDSLPIVKAASRDNKIVGNVDGYLTVWDGVTLTPIVLGRPDNQPIYARDVSADGRYIVGHAGTNLGGPPFTSDGVGISKPFVYHNGAFTVIDVPGYDFAEAVGVNDAGLVVGYTVDFDVTDMGVYQHLRSFAWKDGVLTMDAFIVPKFINDDGLVVGSASGASIYIDGQSHYLGDLAGFPVDDPDVFLIDVRGLNDAGQIVGMMATSATPGYPGWYRLSPIVPDPGTATLIVPAVTSGFLRRRR